MTRRINAAGLAHVKQWEGLKTKAYFCPAGKLTIGYGSTGKHVYPGMVITEARAEKLLREDLDRFEKAVERMVTVPINDNQFAVLVSFAFNVGIGAFEESTLLRKLNDGNYSAVPSELMKWTKATVKGRKVTMEGLVNRRKAEGALWRSAKPAPATTQPRQDARKPSPAPDQTLPEPAPGGWLAKFLATLGRIF